jgi:cytoskeletal protein CcmA (bactofilin family)
VTTKKQDATTNRKIRTKGGKVWGEVDKSKGVIIIKKGQVIDTIDVKELQELLASS